MAEDCRAQRRANAGRPDKKAPSYGAPIDTPAPSTRKRPKVGPADAATRRREIERRVEAGQETTRRSRRATKTEAPKPEPKTVGTPDRSTYETLRTRGEDIDKVVEEVQE